MSEQNIAATLDKDPSTEFHFRYVLVFLFAMFIAWALNIAPQMIRAAQVDNFLIRTSLIILGDLLLLYVTSALLKRYGISVAVLGLKPYGRIYKNVLIGVAIGIISIAVLALTLYVFVPYSFVYKSLNASYVLKESYSYLLGAFLEEMMFRGFLLVVFSKLFGWRAGVLIMALPFGLYHLAGGISLVASTTVWSSVFALSFILTRSLWTAVFVHATVNIFLHLITGLDGAGKSVFTLAFKGQIPSYPFGLAVSVISALVSAVVLYLLIMSKGRAELVTSNPQ